MDTYVDERDYKLLETDKYPFFVLKKIMGGECNLLLSDHERLILCFTGHPFPVWIWTSDDAAEEEMEKAYQLAKENKLLFGKHHFNIKYSLAEYFIRRAAEEGSELKIITNMFAYDCLDTVRPDTEAGYVPMLYTDADYVASNACYKKIGYVLRGKLCTIG